MKMTFARLTARRLPGLVALLCLTLACDARQKEPGPVTNPVAASPAAVPVAVPAPLPTALLGTWTVSQVLVDLGTTRTLGYQHNDSQLMGKTFSIGTGQLSNNTPEARSCTAPSGLVRETSAGTLIETTFPGRGVPAVAPRVKDYDFPLAPSAAVTAVSIVCHPGRFGPLAPDSQQNSADNLKVGTWITALPDGRLAMRWYDETILILRPGTAKG